MVAAFCAVVDTRGGSIPTAAPRISAAAVGTTRSHHRRRHSCAGRSYHPRGRSRPESSTRRQRATRGHPNPKLGPRRSLQGPHHDLGAVGAAATGSGRPELPGRAARRALCRRLHVMGGSDPDPTRGSDRQVVTEISPIRAQAVAVSCWKVTTAVDDTDCVRGLKGRRWWPCQSPPGT